MTARAGKVSTKLDHIGIIVPDLARAARDFEALGFTLTPEASHNAAGGQPAGSVQRSVMLHDGYIELQQITGPAGSHLLSAAQDKFHGLHILAFGVDDAEKANNEVKAQGIPAGAVMEWSRSVQTPDGPEDARFSFFVADYHPNDEALLCWVHHRTPHLLRTQALLEHANTARSLSGVGLMAANDALAGTVQGRMVAAGGNASRDGVSFGDASLFIHTATNEPESADWPAPAFARDIHITLGDIYQLAERARSAGWPVSEEGAGVAIDLRAPYNVRIVAHPQETRS